MSLIVLSLFTAHANASWLTDALTSRIHSYYDYAYQQLAPEKKEKLEKLRGQAVEELKKKGASNDPAHISISRVFLCISFEMYYKIGVCSEVSTHYLPAFAAVFGSGDDLDLPDADVFALMYDGTPTSLHGTTFVPAESEDGDGIMDMLIQTYHDSNDKKRTIAVTGMSVIPGTATASELTIYETDSTETIQKRIVDGKYLDEF